MSESSPAAKAALTVDQAAAVARLARLTPDADLLARFASQCNDILAAMESLGEVDTEGVAPLFSPMDHAPVLREDVVTQRFPRDAILANAPDTDGSFFIVPKIV